MWSCLHFTVSKHLFDEPYIVLLPRFWVSSLLVGSHSSFSVKRLDYEVKRLAGKKKLGTRGSPQTMIQNLRLFLVERLLVPQLGQWLANQMAQYTFPIALLLLY